jgi:hypothetical protein
LVSEGCEQKEVQVKRLSFFFALAAVIALVLPMVGSADRPTREFLPLEDYTIEGQCPFDVDVDVLAIKEYAMTFSDGRTTITGKVFLRVTNADTGKSIEVNASGPGTITTGENGAVTFEIEGRALIGFDPGTFGPGSPGLLEITTGLVVITFDENGNTTYTKTSAATEDVCAILADP